MIDWSFRGWAHGQLNAAACSLELSLLKCFCICIYRVVQKRHKVNDTIILQPVFEYSS